MKLNRFHSGAGALLIGLITVAASIALTFRWEIAGNREGAVRLDRWKGTIVQCRYDFYEARKNPFAPHVLHCDVE